MTSIFYSRVRSAWICPLLTKYQKKERNTQMNRVALLISDNHLLDLAEFGIGVGNGMEGAKYKLFAESVCVALHF